MEIKVLPAIAITLGLGVFVFAIASGGNKRKAFNDAVEGVPDFNPKIIADSLYDSMRETDFSDEEKKISIFSTLEGISENQFKQVIAKFGLKKYNTYFGNQWLAPYSYGLRKWLYEELSKSAYSTLKQQFPNSL